MDDDRTLDKIDGIPRPLDAESIAAAEVEAAAETRPMDETAEATDPILCFRVGPSLFAVVAMAAVEICEQRRAFPIPRAPAHIPGLINLRGRIVPLLDLGQFLHFAQDSTDGRSDSSARSRRVVVVTGSDMEVGLLCDQVMGVMEYASDCWKRAGTEGNELQQGIADALVQTADGIITVLNVQRLLDQAQTLKQPAG